MRLHPGRRLGAYEIVAAIGAGGMGEVYRAHDTSLRREVAVKVVHADLCSSTESLARFRQEARALATLNHPHVATVHEFDESEGLCFLVMELVPGETLDCHLARERPGLKETLRLFVQIAAAIEAAHDHGIVHRDLKPANIRITPNGVAKVLDFGLAKAVGADRGALGASASTLGTDPGVVMGTPAYMSPEQTRGRAVDHRTDIWAFGCVLFEAVAAQPPFAAETRSDTVVRILEHEPDWSRLPAHVPALVRRLLRRCLEKDPHRRLQSIGDARLDLEEAIAEPAAAPGPIGPDRAGPRRVMWAWTLGALLAGLALGFAISLGVRRPPAAAPRPAAHLLMPLPAGERLAATDFPAIAVAPDGRHVVYVGERGGRTQLFLRPMDILESTPIAGTADAISPFFSPDSQSLAFFANGKLKKVAIAGGTPVTICDAAIGFGGSWGSSGTIVFAPTTGSALLKVHADGGTPERVTTLDTARGEFSHRWPHLLPGGRAVVFTVGTLGSWDDAEIVVQSLETERRATLVTGGTHPQYAASGHLLYARASVLMAVAFDAERLAVSGSPSAVIDSVLESVDGAAQVSISQSGAVVYVPAELQGTSRRLAAVDRSGAATPLAAPARAYTSPHLSPDGRRLAVTISGATEDIWVHELGTGGLTQLTFEANNHTPVWTPNGERITFSSTRSGPPNLFVVGADGRGTPQRLSPSERVQVPGSWSPDGSILAFVELHPTTGRDILLLHEERGRTLQPYRATPFHESSPQISPDGRWMAYVSNESGRNEVYVGSFATPGQRTRVSRSGGMEPVWSRDGRELFFRANGVVWSAAIDAAAGLKVGEPQRLFEASFESGSIDRANYGLGAAGTLLMVQPSGTPPSGHALHLLMNWIETLPARLASANR